MPSVNPVDERTPLVRQSRIVHPNRTVVPDTLTVTRWPPSVKHEAKITKLTVNVNDPSNAVVGSSSKTQHVPTISASVRSNGDARLDAVPASSIECGSLVDSFHSCQEDGLTVASEDENKTSSSPSPSELYLSFS